MSIPFVRVFPGGHRGRQEISRSASVEAMAHRFIAHGGRYVCEILITGEVGLTALLSNGNDWKDVEHGKCQNDEELLELVDDLITKSVTHLRVVH